VIAVGVTTGTAIAVVATLCWLRGRYVVVTVRGESMTPTYQPGERLLVRRTRKVRRGECVVFAEAPQQALALPAGWIVKRAVAVPGDGLPAGQVAVRGDNPERSFDSRHFRPITTDRVLGVVLRPMRAAGGR